MEGKVSKQRWKARLASGGPRLASRGGGPKLAGGGEWRAKLASGGGGPRLASGGQGLLGGGKG